MRTRLCAISLLGLVAVSSASAQTQATEKPARPAAGRPADSGAAAGSSAAASRNSGATSPEDASTDLERALDERRATESKQRIRKRPGYKDQVPAPRV